MIKPVNVPRLVEIDYNTQGDWIDEECRDCGRLKGLHTADCSWIAHLWGDLARD